MIRVLLTPVTIALNNFLYHETCTMLPTWTVVVKAMCVLSSWGGPLLSGGLGSPVSPGSFGVSCSSSGGVLSWFEKSRSLVSFGSLAVILSWGSGVLGFGCSVARFLLPGLVELSMT